MNRLSDKKSNFEPHQISRATSIQILRTVEDLDRFINEWETLAFKSGNPMQQFAFAHAWAELLDAEHKLHVIVSGGSPPRAIAPLVIRNHRLRRLEFLGSELYEPLDFIYDSADSLAQLTDTLAEAGFPLFLQRVEIESPLMASLLQAYSGRGWVSISGADAVPWIPLDETWTHPERHFNSDRRSDFRRMLRIAETWGPVSFEISTPTLTELPSLMDEAFYVEAAGWKGRQGTALLQDKMRSVFLRNYARALCQMGLLKLAFLRIGDRTAAMQMAIQSENRFWLLKIGYDETFSRCSPGTLLMLETIRYAAKCGLSSYELLGQMEPWTKLWTSSYRPCVSIQIYPANLQGGALMALDLAGKIRRNAIHFSPWQKR